MKIYKRFSLGRKGTPHALYEAVRCFRPDMSPSGVLTIEARTGETEKLVKVALAVILCRACGLKRVSCGPPGSYTLDMAREYEAEDLLGSELLLLGGQPKHQVSVERDREKRLLLDHRFLQGLKVGSVWNFTVVSGAVRELLESSKLIGLEFTEAVPKVPSQAFGSFWEVRSRLILPKMANQDRLMYCASRNSPEERFTGDYSRMVFLDDAPYRSGEIHYERSELLSIGGFDIAQTFELYRQPCRELVISQRFYEACLKHDIILTAEPIRIDP